MVEKFNDILITAPTSLEIQPLLSMAYCSNDKYFLEVSGSKIQLLAGGVGTPKTMYSLMQVLEKGKFDLIIQMGIAGTFFPHSYPNGTLALVREDVFADILLDDGAVLKPLVDFGFHDYNSFPFANGWLQNKTDDIFEQPLPYVRSITVNTVTGNPDVIKMRQDLFSPELETMEGAALFYVAFMKNIPCVQLRAVSNAVGDRNTKNWDIPLAVENLNAFVKRELFP